MRMVYVSTAMPHPLVVSLLDGLYPSRRAAWKRPDTWHLDRSRGAGVDVQIVERPHHGRTDVTLRVWDRSGPQTVKLLTLLLDHDGTAAFTAAQFAGAVAAAGAADPLDLLLPEPADTEVGWGVVANVEGGTHLFAANAKVWMSERFNGGDDRRWVVGRHRGSGRYIRAVVEHTLLICLILCS